MRALTKDLPTRAPGSRSARISNDLSPNTPWPGLQQTLGNQVVQRMVRAHAIQAKLRLNQPSDPYEQEADRVAAQVLAEPAHPDVSSAPPRFQRYAAQATGHADAPPRVDHVLAGSGKPLDPALRQDMELRFGLDFSRVRVHSGAAAEQSARDVNATAYTVGQNMVFGAGRFAPRTLEGRRLIAHELTHVVQQSAEGASAVAPAPVSRVQRDTAETELQPLGPLVSAATEFLSKYRHGLVWDIDGAAEGLVDYIEQHKRQHRTAYPFVRAVIHAIGRELEDNLAAAFVDRLPTTRLNVLTLTPEGRAMMDVLYAAMITGNVSSYQRMQTERLLEAKRDRTSQATFLESIDPEHLMVFPIRNIGVTRLATATFRAVRLPNGKVKVRYTSIKVTQFDMFKKDLETLPPWSVLRDGFELDPEQIVAVRLHDQGGELVPIPALALIDYSNQIQEQTISTAATAFFLGLSLGAGALGSAGVRGLQAEVAAGEATKASLWVARSLLWADRIAWAIPAGSMVINDHRDWIVETFPTAGPGLLEAVDTANRVAGYYGWGRLTVGTLRYLGSKVRGALGPWRKVRAEAAKRTDLSAHAQKRIKAVEDEADSLVNELDLGEEQAQAAAGGGRTTTTKPTKDYEQAEAGTTTLSARSDASKGMKGGDKAKTPAKPTKARDQDEGAVAVGKGDPSKGKKGGDKGGTGTAGTRVGRTYRINGNPTAIAESKQGYQVYEYRNETGDLLYVGKSGGASGEKPMNWTDRLKNEHIQKEWIGEARTVTVTSKLVEQEALALEEALIPTAKYNVKLGEHSTRFPQGGTSASAATATKHGSVNRFLLDIMF